jgi:predicted MFS family arabinose efflux permease
MNSVQSRTREEHVQSAYLWTSILNAPFWALYGMLLFILYKDLHASALEISLFIALKPGVSLLSTYWSALVHQRPDRLRINIIAASLLGHLPFFIVPFFASSSLLIAAGAFYMMLMRGIIPAWMEILKLYIPKRKREKLFSLGSVISYVGAIVLPLLFGKCLDFNPASWRLFFPIAAFFSLCGMFFQWRIPLGDTEVLRDSRPFKEVITHPWKTSWQLLKARPDFWRYQVGFMLLGGGGLMILQPALPLFFVDRLALSYTELALALSVCKAIGFVLTSRLWTQAISRFSFYRLSSCVTLLAGLFPLLLLLAETHLVWIYAAYLIYGVMQAGSELSWHFSGPHFSKEEESSRYSSVNVLLVGMRGLIVPFIGSLLCTHFEAQATLIVGSLLCLAACLQLNRAHFRSESSQSLGAFSTQSRKGE